MKKTISLIIFGSLLQLSALHAQPAPASDPSGFTNGQVVLPDNSTVTGSVKDNIRKKGEVTLVNEGKTTKYKAADINSVRIGNVLFITSNYTFYELIWEGKNISLLRKANEPSGVQYNGSDPVVISSEGSIDDLFIKKTGDASLQLLTKKNVKEVLGGICSNCVTAIDATKFDAASVKKAVENCDGCK